MDQLKPMQTITQTKPANGSDPVVLSQMQVRDSVRRFIKSEAARLGKSMGDYITDLLITHGGFTPQWVRKERRSA